MVARITWSVSIWLWALWFRSWGQKMWVSQSTHKPEGWTQIVVLRRTSQVVTQINKQISLNPTNFPYLPYQNEVEEIQYFTTLTWQLRLRSKVKLHVLTWPQHLTQFMQIAAFLLFYFKIQIFTNIAFPIFFNKMPILWPFNPIKCQKAARPPSSLKDRDKYVLAHHTHRERLMANNSFLSLLQLVALLPVLSGGHCNFHAHDSCSSWAVHLSCMPPPEHQPQLTSPTSE